MGGIAESVANGSESVAKKLALSSSDTANSIKERVFVFVCSPSHVLSDGSLRHFT